MKTARIEMIASMVIFGTLGPFVRKIPVTSEELALYRAMLAALVIGIFLIMKAKCASQLARFTCLISTFRSNADLRRELPLLFLSGAAMGINWILLFQAYKYTTVSIATLSYYFAPVIVTAVCPLLFREKMSGRQLFCFLMSTLGVILIIGNGGFHGSGSDMTGILFGLGAAVFYAAVVILNKFIKNITGIHRTFLQFLAAIIVLLPYIAASGGTHLGRLTTTGWINLLIVGLIHTGFAYCLYFSSLRELRGQEAAILSYIDPLVAVLISVSVLGEKTTFWQVVGGILILGFAFLNERSSQ